MTTAVHDGDHNVSFDLDARHGWLLSEPTPLEPILNGSDFQEEMHIRLRDESRLSDRVNAALVHLTNTVIDVVSKRGGPLAARGILRRLFLDIRRVSRDPRTGVSELSRARCYLGRFGSNG